MGQLCKKLLNKWLEMKYQKATLQKKKNLLLSSLYEL